MSAEECKVLRNLVVKQKIAVGKLYKFLLFEPVFRFVIGIALLFFALCPVLENSSRQVDMSGLPRAIVPVWAPAYRRDLHGFELARGQNDEGPTTASAATINEDSDEGNQTSRGEDRKGGAVARKSNTRGRKRGSISRQGSGWRNEAADIAWKKGDERARLRKRASA